MGGDAVMKKLKVLAVSTTTHGLNESTSVAMSRAVLERLSETRRCEIKAINANDLHIVKNLSCYSNGKRDCANPEAGPYRCWAQVESQKDPKKFGGVDQMPLIYDGLGWCDLVLWSTSVRWGSHSALMQKIIERMNTLENRGSSWGEPYPMAGKRCGVIVSGLHWKSRETAAHLQEVFRWFAFDVPPEDGALVWQRTRDPFYEQPASILPQAERWLRSPEGERAVDVFLSAVLR
jgi:multimeric flavodoxin WrbA